MKTRSMNNKVDLGLEEVYKIISYYNGAKPKNPISIEIVTRELKILQKCHKFSKNLRRHIFKEYEGSKIYYLKRKNLNSTHALAIFNPSVTLFNNSLCSGGTFRYRCVFEHAVSVKKKINTITITDRIFGLSSIDGAWDVLVFIIERWGRVSIHISSSTTKPINIRFAAKIVIKIFYVIGQKK